MSSLAVDTSAAVDYMWPDRNAPPQLALAETIFRLYDRYGRTLERMRKEK